VRACVNRVSQCVHVSLNHSLTPLTHSRPQMGRFKMAGVMLDVSRGAVLTVDSIKFFLRKLALMGINTLLLYLEDVYELPDEPMFGYLRGAYTQAELKEGEWQAVMCSLWCVDCGVFPLRVVMGAYVLWRHTHTHTHEPSVQMHACLCVCVWQWTIMRPCLASR